MKSIQIPKIPPTVNKSIRFPIDVVQKIETTIQGKECTFTAFVVEAVKMMLDELSANETD